MHSASGGGIAGSYVTVSGSSILHNTAYAEFGGWGGGLNAGYLRLDDSTVAGNTAGGSRANASGAAIAAAYSAISNSTITANRSFEHDAPDGVYDHALGAISGESMHLSNSIVVGNVTFGSGGVLADGADITSDIVGSSGHNAFGVISGGNVSPGDVTGVDPASLFAHLDPLTGGGGLVLVNGVWVVPLRDALDNPALSGADPASSGDLDQRGNARPQPGTSNPDIGAYELSQTHLSTTASAHNDVLSGTSGANTLAGKAGNDLLLGLGGNDTLKGEDGGDTLQGGPGDDTLYGGAGIDTASYRDATAGVTVNLIKGSSGGALGHDRLDSIEGLLGGAFADSLGGDAGDNAINGLAGNDKLYGDAGNDTLRGGAGNDLLFGFTGDDTLYGGSGSDTASYADITTGGVTVSLARPDSQFTGAGGTDTLTGIENLIGTALADSLVGNSGANTLTGGLGKDSLTGNAGNDLFDFNTAADSVPGANADRITDFTGAGAAAGDRIDLADVYAGTLKFVGTHAFDAAGEVRVMGSGSDTMVQVNLTGANGAEMEIHVQDGGATPGLWVAGDFIL